MKKELCYLLALSVAVITGCDAQKPAAPDAAKVTQAVAPATQNAAPEVEVAEVEEMTEIAEAPAPEVAAVAETAVEKTEGRKFDPMKNEMPDKPQKGDTIKSYNANDPAIWTWMPEVVAQVDGKDITKQQFIDFLASKLQGGKLPPNVTMDKLQSQAPELVKNYVTMQLLVSAAKKAGFEPSKALVVKMLDAQLSKASPEEIEQVEAALKAQGKTLADYKNEMADNKDTQEEVAIQELIEQKVMSQIQVTDADVKNFYDSYPQYFKIPADSATSIRASHILVKADGNDAAAKAKAEALLAKVKANPAQFEAIAQESSDCPSKAQGGSLGAFEKGQMVPEFDEAAFGLKENEISGLVKTQFGYHIVRRDPSVKQEQTLPFDQVKEQLALMVKNQKSAQAYNQFIDQLFQDNQVKILVQAPTAAATK